MTTDERIEVRIDPERKRRLARLVSLRHSSISKTIRDLIDEAYAEFDRDERIQAAERLGAMAIEIVPDPDTLKRQLEGAYDLPDLR